MNISESRYTRYIALGGIINKNDHDGVMARAAAITAPAELRRLQFQTIAEFSGIDLSKTGNETEVLALYEVLRTDRKPKGVEYHHCQMSDQRLVAETFRMAGDGRSLAKLIAAHPHIPF